MRNFDHTVNVLVKAYLNNTLEHGNCSACAVGNIISESMNTTSLKRKQFSELNTNCIFGNNELVKWHDVFITICNETQVIKTDHYRGKAKEQIDSTGYSWQELAQIEKAFETAERRNNNEDEFIFNGLLAVVDVLAAIHGKDLTTKENAKKLFCKPTEA